MPTGKNALAGETSPYLLQHADNPVQWYPWGEEALARARRERKPVLLSIGYSACHWCHVMAHESFEDEDTAAVMNRHFINIKVDREERPDLDKIYQTAQQLLTQRGGGWPLTMFLTHDDQLPFFGGTYFPPTPRYGMPGFRDLLLRVAEHYEKELDAIRRQNRNMQEALSTTARPAAAAGDRVPDSDLVLAALRDLGQAFDRNHGGFGGAPKFPHPPNLELLLRVHDSPGLVGEDERATALEMAVFSLRQMALGGIHDHLAGGFARYSVDDYWMIPHFEKMLYDNGQLLTVYTDAWHVTGDDLLRDAALGIAEWVSRDMRAGGGGFFSSLDADSEGEEGKYYVWTPAQVRALLDDDEYTAAAALWGLDRGPNFEGHWHLHCQAAPEAVAERLGCRTDALRARIAGARAKLLDARGRRVPPGRDEKILTAWNALMIRGLCRAGSRFGRTAFIDTAADALSFIRLQLWQDGRLLATCKDGRAHLGAYLDDHAYLLEAILAFLACRWSDQWLDFAVKLAHVLLEQFEDRPDGGFFFTAHDHEPLIQRRKDYMDDAIPSGNAVAAGALLQLGHLTADRLFLDAADRCFKAASGSLQRFPHGHTAMLARLLDWLDPPQQVILRGPASQLATWRRQCPDHPRLRGSLYAVPDGTSPGTGFPGRLAGAESGVAYLCEGLHCSAPLSDVEELLTQLKSRNTG